ncbi:MAG TPA: L-threonylcarbamoyladenylate synthase [Bacteroidia bacterium]|nr:L-threonylcarbamoyladenylate synthase [Bacteroidia bacterium]
MTATTTGKNILEAAALLREGKVVAIPTETVYGLAANALNPDAVLEVFRVKERPSFDPLIVHIGDEEQLPDLVESLPDQARMLMDRFWPGPLTLVFRKKNSIPDVVTAGLDTVGVRMPSHPLTLELLRSLPFPLAAPSANPFGYISPTTAKHVADQLGGKIPYILDGGDCEVGVESTIVGFENNKCVIYRYGGISADSISELVGDLVIKTSARLIAPAPGMLESHYAPSKQFRFHLPSQDEMKQSVSGIIYFKKPEQYIRGNEIYEVLSPEGNLDEAARNLFAALRRMDASDATCIFAEPVPDEGLGKAVNDRLRRASAER